MATRCKRCLTYIEWRRENERWIPYNQIDGTRHTCPKTFINFIKG